MSNPPAHHSSPSDVRKVLLWIALILAFLVLSVVRPLLGDTLPARAARTETFNASGTIRSLSVKGVNGDVTVTPGTSFAATAELTVKADSKERADRILGETKVVFENENGKLFLTTKDPQSRVISLNGKKRLATTRHGDEKYRVEARFTITLPASAGLDVSTVNGSLDSKGIAAVQELRTVNGRIDVAGARHGLKLKSVNGALRATCADLPPDARVEAETVNGDVVVVLPAGAGFRFFAKTMNGSIASTFPLPARTFQGRDSEREGRLALREAEREKLRAEREKARAERRTASEDEGEWDVSMEEFSREMEKFGREMGKMAAEIARSVTVNVNRSYEGTVGSGGGSVRCSTLNGKITVLAEGTKPADAKSLVPADKVVTVRIPGRSITRTIVLDEPPSPPDSLPPIPPRPPRVPRIISIPGEEAETRLGDVEGDFSSTSVIGDIVVGKISGFARIRSRSGQITIREAAKGADLSASGGDVRVDVAGGDIEARTLGGNVTVGSAKGSAKLETMGGDIKVSSAGGAVKARTAGGDIVVRKAAGPVNAETLGGTVVCEVVGKSAAPGIELTSGGGDVTLTLPSDFRADVEIQVTGAESESQLRSEFPELTVSRRASTLKADGRLNGGGPRVVIKATSGTVTLKKGPAA